MVNQSAEAVFRKGLQALSRGRRKEAMAMFEAAIEVERRLGALSPQPRYVSFYGLCLALERNAIGEALRYCREATTIEPFNPDLRCNFGRVLIRAGRRREAYEHFSEGLSLQGDHKGIRRALEAMGARRRPVLPFLSRKNPINVLLGRLRPVA
jgi:tetratricopeptide (TPR) repeat protein